MAEATAPERSLTVDGCAAWRARYSRRRTWKRQTTWVTPLERLRPFARALVDHLMPFEQALLVVDQVASKVPPKLAGIRGRACEARSVADAPGHLIAADPQALCELLEASLSGWIDLRVLFSPPRHALRADHDEYATLFSESSGKIAEVERVMAGDGVRSVSYSAPAP